MVRKEARIALAVALGLVLVLAVYYGIHGYATDNVTKEENAAPETNSNSIDLDSNSEADTVSESNDGENSDSVPNENSDEEESHTESPQTNNDSKDDQIDGELLGDGELIENNVANNNSEALKVNNSEEQPKINKTEKINVSEEKSIISIPNNTIFENKTIQNQTTGNFSEEQLVFNVTIINETEATLIEKELIQHRAIIGEPVTWTRTIKFDKEVTRVKIDVHDTAEEIIIKKTVNGSKTEINPNNVKTNQIGTIASAGISGSAIYVGQTSILTYLIAAANWFKNISYGLTGFVTLEPDEIMELTIEDSLEEVYIEYETPGPEVFEDKSEVDSYRITVSSDIHYENIFAFTEIPNGANAVVYNIDGPSKVLVDSEIVEVDGITRVEWIVPHLSEEEYEINITILNIHSFPEVGGNWTVAFNTTGTADLNITKDDVTASEIVFEFLKCGNTTITPIIDGPSILVYNWSCNNETAQIEHTVNISGPHLQTFRFGELEATATNGICGDIPSGQCVNCINCTPDAPFSSCWYCDSGLADGVCFSDLDPVFVCEGGTPILVSGNCPSSNTAPTHDTPYLNATDHPTNSTSANLTCYNQTTADADGDSVTNIYNWYKDGTSIAVLNMPFDTEDASTASDYSSRGNDGTITGATWTASGKVGGAYDFSGSDHIIITADTSLQFTNALTMSFWMNADAFVDNDGIISSGWPGAGDRDYLLWMDPSGEFRFLLGKSDGSGWDIDHSTTGLNINTGVWTHVAITWDKTVNDGKAIFYIDGSDTEHTTSAKTDNIHTSNNPVVIASDYDINDRYDGKLDDVKLYDSALSANQIDQLYQDTVNGFSSDRTMVSEETTIGESWTCQITPNDATEDGTAKTSAALVIENVAPTHATPYLNATDHPTNSTSANLTCYNQTTADADGDSVTNIFNWYKNDVSLESLNMPFESNANDYSSRGNDGTISGATWTASGKVGGAYDFDGSNYIDSGITVSANDATYVAWVKLSGSTAWGNILGVRNGNGFLICARGTGTNIAILAGNSDCSSSANFDDFSTDIIDGAWHHVAATSDGASDEIKVYVDGSHIGTRTGNACGDTETIGIGGEPARDVRHVTGTIDEVHIYDHVLTPEQIDQLYQDTVNGFSSDRTMVSEETGAGEEWICEVTPNDATEDGTAENSSTLTIAAADSTPPTWSAYANNATSATTTGDVVNWNATIADETGLSHYIFSTDDSGSWVNSSAIATSGNPANVDADESINAAIGVSVCGKFYFNDTNNNWNSTPSSCFTVADVTNPTWSAYDNNATAATSMNDGVNWNASIADNVALDYYIFSTNDTSSWVNQTASAIAGNPSSTTVDQDYTLTATGGNVVCGRFYFNDTSGNWNSTPSDCFTLAQYIAIALSDDLSTVSYTSLEHNTQDNPADNNTNASSKTQYWVAVSGDTSTNVDICTKADGNLISGEDVIGLGNYTWDDDTTNSATLPSLGASVAYTTGYVLGTANLAPGNNDYYRFWLDVPQSQPPGTYSNTIYFKAVETGTGCGA